MGQRFSRKKHPPNPTQSFPLPQLLGTDKTSSSPLATVHSPHISNASTLKNLTAAAVGKWAIHSVTSPAASIASYHLTKHTPRNSLVE
ncbi:hypothetical protein AVEN_173506-1 [Araneus ventricosus]|uniref:Uncharacterized protein n=1 Tax=Araneus ventricosus TaxID=182803 RepID=A0A4Y2JPX2_ARAVE|nr:hypothetical protein AVEN_173506-1 [Araneus ventricosus]